MAHSFAVQTAPLSAESTSRRVLVTGAAGRIGSYFAEHSHDRYELRLTDLSFAERHAELGAYGELLEGELHDLAFLKHACSGIDTVLHLAGNPDATATWHELLETNIVGTYQACIAARAAGCRRVVFASSIHAVSGYPPDVQVKTSEPSSPGDLYGVTKCFGESLGRYLSTQEGLSFIAVRIGAFQPSSTAKDPGKLTFLNDFVSRRDLNQLLERCIDAHDSLRFAIFHGLSDNTFKRLDISDARELLGYEPQDNFVAENPLTRDLRLGERLQSASQQHDGAESGIREEL